MEMGLDRVRPGCKAIVTGLRTGPALAGRLAALGFVPGTAVECRYRSPEGRVTAVEFRGTVIAMRTADLKCIRVRC